VQSIGSIGFELGATGGGSDNGGGEKRRRASGRRCSALGNQRRGRRASRGWCSTGCGVVVAREGPEVAAHGEPRAAVDGDHRQPCSDQNWRAAGGWGPE
jgi:hypothetical protein